MIILFYHKLIAPGGAERLIIRQYEYLKSINHPVELWTFETNNNALFGIDRGEILIIRGWFHLLKEIKKNNFAHFIFDSGFTHLSILLLIVPKIRYSVNYHHPLWMSFNDSHKWSLRKTKLTNKRLCQKIKYDSSLIKKPYFLIKIAYTIKEILFSHFLSKAKIIWVLSEYSKREKQEYFGLNPIVRQGAIDDSHLTSFKEKKDPFKILVVSRLDKNKRIDVLINAIFLLKNKLKFKVDIIGIGPEFSSLQTLTNQLGLSKEISFKGFLKEEELSEFYKQASLFVSIDMADFKITMFEALNYGCKVLVSNETEVPIKLKEFVHTTDVSENSVAEAINNLFHSKSPEPINLYLYTWRYYFESKFKDLSSSENVYLTNKFNKIWNKALRFNFYKVWKDQNRLPKYINSIEDLNSWPEITKEELQSIRFSRFRFVFGKTSTSGSTGMPLRLPTNPIQKYYERKIIRYFRSKLFKKYKIILIWGSSHLMTSGISFVLKYLTRNFKDIIFNYTRFSVYDINNKTIESLNKKISTSKKNFLLIGYAKMIFRLIKNSNFVSDDKLKFILTAEGLSPSEKKWILNKKLNLEYEYGMSETNVISYKYSFLFNSNFITIPSHVLLQMNNKKEALITCLYSRSFPLIRYNTKDIIELNNSTINYKGGLLNSFSDVKGRSNDFITIKTNCLEKEVHSEYFSHVFKSIDGIQKFKVVQNKNSDIEVLILKSENLKSQQIYDSLKKNLNMTNNIKITFVDDFISSNGKTIYNEIQ